MRLDNIKLMMTKEECEKRARELLKTPKEDVLTNYMFMEQEIDRLNNIINELEKYCEEEQHIFRPTDKFAYSKVLDKLKELKEGNKQFDK